MSTKGHPKVSEYMNRNYPVHLDYSEEDNYWIARYPDLPGCLADGDTREEALLHADEARETWIQAALETGKAIPAPSPNVEDEEYSGNFMVRGPSYVHRQLATHAERQGSSMNKLVVGILTAAAALSDLARMGEAIWGALKMPAPKFTPGNATLMQQFFSRRTVQETVREESWANVPFLPQGVGRNDLTQKGSD